MTVLERIAASGLVQVVRVDRAADAPDLARTLAGAGLACIEITFRTDAAVDSIRAIRADVPEVLVGAGTVVTLDQLDRALEAGAGFIVSPGLHGLILGYLAGHPPALAVEYGGVHGALAMTTPRDTSMANQAEVEALVAGVGERVRR